MRKLFLLLLTILAVSMSAAAQTRTVRGIVISGDDNEPIVGASVMVVGTQLGSSTDVEGKFVIKNVPSDAKSLRVSYVGMTSQDVPITKGEIRIVLGLNSELLDEVVVTALGISRSEKSHRLAQWKSNARSQPMSCRRFRVKWQVFRSRPLQATPVLQTTCRSVVSVQSTAVTNLFM